MDDAISCPDSNSDGDFGSYGSQPISGRFKNAPENEIVVEVSVLGKATQYGPLRLSAEGGEDYDPRNVCLQLLPAVLKLLGGGCHVELIAGVKFAIPCLLDSHVLVVIPPDGTRRTLVRQILCAVEIRGSTVTFEEVLCALRTDFQHSSCQTVEDLYGYSLKRLDNLPNAFCAGSVLIGVIPTDEVPLTGQAEFAPSDFDVVEPQPNSRLTSTYNRASITCMLPSPTLQTGSVGIRRHAMVPVASRTQTEELIAPFKDNVSQLDGSPDIDEQPDSPPNISLAPVGASTFCKVQEGIDSPRNVRGSGSRISEGDDNRLEHEQPLGLAGFAPILPASSRNDEGVRLLLAEDTASLPRRGNEEQVRVESDVNLAPAVCQDSLDDCRDRRPSLVFGLNATLAPLGARKECVVPSISPLVPHGESGHLVLPKAPATQGGSLEKFLDRSGEDIKTNVIDQETSYDDRDPREVEVCALEHASNGHCSLCRLENRSECRIVRFHFSLVDKLCSQLSSIRKISSMEEEGVKEIIRRHCQWCRDISCKVPHIYAGCPIPGMQSLSGSHSYSPPLTAKGDGSKEMCVPPAPNFPSILHDPRRRVHKGVMVFDQPENRHDPKSHRQIKFPDKIVGKEHGDAIYFTEDMAVLEGCFKHIPSIESIRKQDILGKGGNGIVFRRPFGGVSYAFKLTPYRKLELEIWSNLKSENVTSLLAVLVYSPTGFASKPKCLQVMPLMAGTLHSHLKVIGGSLLEARKNEPNLWNVFRSVWLVLEQVLTGLGYLADNRVYYCDLKTSNVLVHKRCACDSVFHCCHYDNWSLRPVMKLGDFDSARTFKSANTEAYTAYRDYPMVTKSPEICAKELGTVGNRAPEQFLRQAPVIDPVSVGCLTGGLVGHWSDMWSFGTMIIRVFLGRTPPSVRKEAWTLLLQTCRISVDKSFPQHENMSTMLMLKNLCMEDDQDFRKAAKMADRCLKGDYRERPSAHRLLDEFFRR